ncbi:MAG TPA: CopD family protein [Candidatus Dormibacteraeota bacterium]|nr:CopD family protein [Candidatus Dormibacteraeota bacterium]
MSAVQAVLLFLCHWLEYLGLLGGLGSFVVRRLGRNRPRLEWANPPMHLAFGAAVVGGLGVLLLGSLHGPSTWFVLARVLCEAAALAICLRGRPAVAPFAVLAAILLAFSGHASAQQPAAGAEFADAIHVLSAGMWAGGIMALATLRPPDGWNGAEAMKLLERFGRVAVIAFGVTALTGVLRATEQLNLLSTDLWTTTYGIVLVLKTTGVLVMLASSFAWRRGLNAARVEAAVVVVVVAATALLATLPAPAPGVAVMDLVHH